MMSVLAEHVINTGHRLDAQVIDATPLLQQHRNLVGTPRNNSTTEQIENHVTSSLLSIDHTNQPSSLLLLSGFLECLFVAAIT